MSNNKESITEKIKNKTKEVFNQNEEDGERKPNKISDYEVGDSIDTVENEKNTKANS